MPFFANSLISLTHSNLYTKIGLSIASIIGAELIVSEISQPEESAAINIVRSPSIIEHTIGDNWLECAAEGEICKLPSGIKAQVRYGASGKFIYRDVTDAVGCSNGTFGGDPVPYVVKACTYTKTTDEFWTECATEGQVCKLPNGVKTQVRYGTAGKFIYRDVAGAIPCTNGMFGEDPVPFVVKACAYVSSTPQPSVPGVNGKPTAARDRLGINVASTIYWSGEQTFANQMMSAEWREPGANWSYVSSDRLKDGVPAAVEAGHAMIAFLTPPAAAAMTGSATTRCTWVGTGRVTLNGLRRDIASTSNSVTFAWPKDIPSKQTVQFEIQESKASDPIRSIDCRLTTDPADAVFAPQLLDYLKPFGVLRFLDWSSANGNPASVTWATRGTPGGLRTGGSDGVPLEYQIGLAKAVGSSPWFTIPWNADADYIRRMAQLVHDAMPAGKPVYVEISNEVWNYQFGQAHQAQKEGLERRLSDNGFGANIARYAQKITEVMPIWSDVFKDRPSDLVRVAATQAANPWVGEQILEWNGKAALPYIDAMAIAPYFHIYPSDLTGNHANNMAAIAAEANRQIAVQSAAYNAMASRYGKRLIAYEGGQHQIDAGNQSRLAAMNRDPLMQEIYRKYLTDWNAMTGDLFTLYAATGPISVSGAWGLREYAGQPISETPKLRGVIAYTGQ